MSKRLIFRRVHGEPVRSSELKRLREALDAFGAARTELVVVSSQDFAPGEAYDRGAHHLIEEDGERWGPIEKWRPLV